MGNVNMEAAQIHDRTEAGKHQTVAEHLKALDALAQQIEDMPAYTSSDRAWLDEWESKLPELPEDPETDGVKVLTATTTSGETVKSWEEPESGGGVDYSTTEHTTGQKWIDGKEIYSITKPVSAMVANASQDITLTNVDNFITAFGLSTEGTPIPYTDTVPAGNIGWYYAGNSTVKIITSTSRTISGGYITCFYTKTA